MHGMSRQPPPPRAPGGPQRNESRPGGPAGPGDQGWRSPIALALFGVLVVGFLLELLLSGSGKTQTITYSDFLDKVKAGQVTKVDIGEGSTSSRITVKAKDATGKEKTYVTTGPSKLPDDDIKLLRSKNIVETHHSQSGSAWGPILTLGLPILLLVGFWFWMSRRAQGQMAGLMSIGRSRAKVYTTEKPKTTFADVAGYTGVKREINEVVDFLKQPNKFREIGARIPKGVLLVGPPGTGKTLIARAVAGEAGVPFMSITGSDFMEMFVGVGAARVRDLFQTARKQAPCIIFVDEIDSIGRKRGAGLGGGHDEREQTLNQMLAEMDGFETTEGIVMMAATNRPDILDPALLRPGRFDRQVVVPLPDLEERLPILKVHCRDKKIAEDVDLAVVARGTPGMSGADLANLVNEAALFAVRRGAHEIHMEDFEAARDRILMGQRRESTVLSEAEKEHTAYHEGGHAVLAYVLPHADPVHKVTILPTGMALGATQQLPAEERHMYSEEYIEDMLCVMMGGRCAERVVFGELSTGAADDLQRSTEMARRMVREWGMSERVGPMAWGQQGAVFLGEDLMHTRDYSDDTARVVDEEVERILRAQEDRAMEKLQQHRTGLDAVAKALRDAETIDGAMVRRLVDEAFGKPVHGDPDAALPDATQFLETPDRA
ncbi:MAG: ATP-dependent metalloprotease FtsH [Acidimicrobiales bacterium]|jgi:cell division protease FtsH|nr:ATP-dependent metalloprotease FtsH [Acidimicrobiales bacterium]